MMPIIEKNQIEAVILGGNIAKAFPIFAPYLLGVFKQNNYNTKIKVSALNEHAALIGAASCCKITI